MKKLWQVYPKIQEDFKIKHPDINPVILQLLKNRKVKEEDFAWFLDPKFDSIPDPFLFKDMEKAVNIIISHIKERNKILIYGDYDADGITSTAILFEVLDTLHARIDAYMPDRASEGYGLNKAAIEKFAQEDVKLIITVDNGIRNKAEVEFAQSLGLEIIVTDHHVFPEDKNDWPGCLIINPAHPEDNYPYKNLAGVGVAFKLASALTHHSKLNKEDKAKLLRKQLDLVALGTVADLVPLLGENRALVKKGLEVMNSGLGFFHRGRLGLKQLIKESGLDLQRDLETWNISFQLAPRLNASGRLKHANTAFDLLTSKDKVEAKELSQELNLRNQKRQSITQEIVSEALNNIKDQENDMSVVALGTENYWNEGVIGLVAGRLNDKYYKPALVITQIKGKDGNLTFKGSGRSIAEFNLMETLEDLSEYLDKYGGHPLACGFSVYSREKLDKFISNFKKIAEEKLAGKKLLPKISIDIELDIIDLSPELLVELDKLRPYGQNNSRPSLVSYNQKIDDIVFMGTKKQHIKFKFGETWGIAFGQSEKYKDLVLGDSVDVIYSPEFNHFNGSVSIQLKIIDLQKHGKQ